MAKLRRYCLFTMLTVAYIFMLNLKWIVALFTLVPLSFLLLTDTETKRSTNLRRKQQRGKQNEEKSSRIQKITLFLVFWNIKRKTQTTTRLYNRADLYSSRKMGHFTRHSCLLALILCLVFNTQVSHPIRWGGRKCWRIFEQVSCAVEMQMMSDSQSIWYQFN